MSIAEQLREQIETSDKSRYEIARQSGIAQSVLARFVAGETSLSMANVEKLVSYFELELTERPKGKKHRGKTDSR
ncbi:XRE family transcriptional regulator [Bremerella cremea]|uniref:HTH cro/C1-type domain-containing protein n=1 Tax=Blastopirellula marina TaxID=124 RepID=A0A2S8FZG5_9BACT|nr:MULTISPECIES: helix-turn-helix transcriptional regulator [Pirellulaceae]PQO37587.1 hypothetical protein C5Y83_06480 [Blastopirellula marina]RCS49974.1 XRE family transcriptional regulator [Bremerella cremea]